MKSFALTNKRATVITINVFKMVRCTCDQKIAQKALMEVSYEKGISKRKGT